MTSVLPLHESSKPSSPRRRSHNNGSLAWWIGSLVGIFVLIGVVLDPCNDAVNRAFADTSSVTAFISEAVMGGSYGIVFDDQVSVSSEDEEDVSSSSVGQIWNENEEKTSSSSSDEYEDDLIDATAV
jgi:hypothetical protein